MFVLRGDTGLYHLNQDGPKELPVMTEMFIKLVATEHLKCGLGN